METLGNIYAISEGTLHNHFRTFDHVVKKSIKRERPIIKTSSKNSVVFLVDDDLLYLKALELSISGYMGSVEIHSFITGEECLKHLNLKPAVVILDYYLNTSSPNAQNGVEVLKRIKRVYPKTKVILLSAQDSLNIAIDCMENGAYDYIAKSQTSFIRINNLLSNIFGDIETSSTFFKTIQYILLIIILVIIASVLINH